MTGRARFGDFLNAGHRSLDSRAGELSPVRGDVEEVSRSLLRVVTILGRYTQDTATAFRDVPHRTAGPASPWSRARVEAPRCARRRSRIPAPPGGRQASVAGRPLG